MSDPITDADLARVRELATILARFGLFASQDRVTELSSLAPRLAAEVERLRAENERLREDYGRLENQLRLCEEHAGTMAEDFDKGVKVMRADLARAHAALVAAREALESEERHQWAIRNREAISDPLDGRILGLKMEVERTAHESGSLRKSALATLNETLKP